MIRIMLGTEKKYRTTTSVTETVRERRSGHKKFFSGFSGATTALSKAVKTCGAGFYPAPQCLGGSTKPPPHGHGAVTIVSPRYSSPFSRGLQLRTVVCGKVIAGALRRELLRPRP